MKLLIVEDQPIDLKLVSTIFESEGYEILTAQTAEMAFNIIEENKPQLVFLDLGLPGMDGLALTHKVKAELDTQYIHIIAVTAYSDKWQKEELIKAGCIGYIVKPINTRTFVNQVKDMISKATEEG